MAPRLVGRGAICTRAMKDHSTGAATLALSSVGWGLTQGVLLSEVLEAGENSAAFLRTAEVLGGIGCPILVAGSQHPNRGCARAIFMGYWAAQMADLGSIFRWLCSEGPDYICYSDEYYKL